MWKIREALRLQAIGLSKRKIAASISVGTTAADAYIGRARRAGLSWPLPDDLSDEALEQLLFPAAPRISGSPGGRCITMGSVVSYRTRRGAEPEKDN